MIETWKDDFGAFVNSLNLSRDDYKTMMEYIDEIPAVQPDHVADVSKKVSISCGHENDMISRQAAIDIERNATVDTNPSHFEAHQKFTQFMDDAEVSSFGRWQWSNGFNTALTAVGIDLKKLPSVQPERKRGEWKRSTDNGYSMYECSVCECRMWKTEYDKAVGTHGFRFCPYCGADMRDGACEQMTLEDMMQRGGDSNE